MLAYNVRSGQARSVLISVTSLTYPPCGREVARQGMQAADRPVTATAATPGGSRGDGYGRWWVNIGDALAHARRQAGLTITEVSQQTRIRETIIRDIERDDFCPWP